MFGLHVAPGGSTTRRTGGGRLPFHKQKRRTGEKMDTGGLWQYCTITTLFFARIASRPGDAPPVASPSLPGPVRNLGATAVSSTASARRTDDWKCKKDVKSRATVSLW
ncbi:hypothetical protein E2C01_085080 [Portunus trituberculatus]|uniref:Uncharacterized protein n=1 Tax=Portunus trituberculatus TaxID=210409 RepID=A0A5B7IWZ9_PORTR|nr:hypothetical protein [Portunus trituberculatus]